MYLLQNVMEEAVRDVVAKRFKAVDDSVCKCEKCRLDIAAIALNSLMPHYTVSEQGHLLVRVSNQLNDQARIDIEIAVEKAFRRVITSPKH